MEDLAERMLLSGYPEDYRRSVLEAVLGGYEGQVATAERGEKLLYRPRGWQEASRRQGKAQSSKSVFTLSVFFLVFS